MLIFDSYAIIKLSLQSTSLIPLEKMRLVVVPLFLFLIPSVIIWFLCLQLFEYKYYIYGTVARKRIYSIYIILCTFVIYYKDHKSIVWWFQT